MVLSHTLEGLVRYKKLTPNQARMVIKVGENTAGYSGPITMMYPREEYFDPKYFDKYPDNTNSVTAERLLYGGLDTLLRLCKSRL